LKNFVQQRYGSVDARGRPAFRLGRPRFLIAPGQYMALISAEAKSISDLVYYIAVSVSCQPSAISRKLLVKKAETEYR
jgi:hypothetical protein